jgi:hypothetical protein
MVQSSSGERKPTIGFCVRRMWCYSPRVPRAVFVLPVKCSDIFVGCGVRTSE